MFEVGSYWDWSESLGARSLLGLGPMGQQSITQTWMEARRMVVDTRLFTTALLQVVVIPLVCGMHLMPLGLMGTSSVSCPLSNVIFIVVLPSLESFILHVALAAETGTFPVLRCECSLFHCVILKLAIQLDADVSVSVLDRSISCPVCTQHTPTYHQYKARQIVFVCFLKEQQTIHPKSE